MFTCLGPGVVVIAGNYLELLPGGEASNNFLLIGLVLLIAGFVFVHDSSADVPEAGDVNALANPVRTPDV